MARTIVVLLLALVAGAAEQRTHPLVLLPGERSPRFVSDALLQDSPQDDSAPGVTLTAKVLSLGCGQHSTVGS